MKICSIYFLLALCMWQTAQGRILHIGKSIYPFTNIKQALINSLPGDTLIIHKGVYKEGNIVINKPLTIIGDSMPTLDGDYRFEVLTIMGSHITISGLRIQHSGFAVLEDPGGIKIRNSSFVVISNNELVDNFFGVYVEYSTNILISHNHIEAHGIQEQSIGNGIHSWKSDSLQIIRNHIEGHRDGIYFEFVTHTLVWRNTAENNIRYGLHFMFSNDDNYFTNVFRNNGAGVAVMFSKRVNMRNNKFEKNWGSASYGLLLKEISDSDIEGNHFLYNTSAIFMEGTSRIRALRNNFVGNGWAMQVQASCLDNAINGNNFINNTFDIGTNGSVVLNNFDNNYWDKYTGYDLDKDHIGDVPFRPLSLFSVVVERNPSSMLLFRSFLVTLLDQSEKIFPTLTPENFMDKMPAMRAYPL